MGPSTYGFYLIKFQIYNQIKSTIQSEVDLIEQNLLSVTLAVIEAYFAFECSQIKDWRE